MRKGAERAERAERAEDADAEGEEGEDEGASCLFPGVRLSGDAVRCLLQSFFSATLKRCYKQETPSFG